jgi:hypothetical protein
VSIGDDPDPVDPASEFFARQTFEAVNNEESARELMDISRFDLSLLGGRFCPTKQSDFTA